MAILRVPISREISNPAATRHFKSIKWLYLRNIYISRRRKDEIPNNFPLMHIIATLLPISFAIPIASELNGVPSPDRVPFGKKPFEFEHTDALDDSSDDQWYLPADFYDASDAAQSFGSLGSEAPENGYDEAGFGFTGFGRFPSTSITEKSTSSSYTIGSQSSSGSQVSIGSKFRIIKPSNKFDFSKEARKYLGLRDGEKAMIPRKEARRPPSNSTEEFVRELQNGYDWSQGSYGPSRNQVSKQEAMLMDDIQAQIRQGVNWDEAFSTALNRMQSHEQLTQI